MRAKKNVIEATAAERDAYKHDISNHTLNICEYRLQICIYLKYINIKGQDV